MKKLLYFLFLVFSTQQLLAQGVTTSSMSGIVTDAGGVTLIGANILAVHTPTGSSYGTATDLDGNYRIANMKVGGPYTLTVSYTGYGDQSAEGIVLRLGERKRQDFTLSEASVTLDVAIVIAKAGSTGQGAGAATQITSEDIDLMPTLDRQLEDFTRLTPQASTGTGNLSIAGMNNRFNAIYIDGAVNNDVFGLSGSGTNGGQTGISPISIDVIDQIQVVLSPYDVSLGGFAGGGINAVTKSGTNEFAGTAYSFWQNQSFAGKTNGKLIERTGSEAEKLDKFSENIIGLSLGGPIVKDKVFFFANVELQKDETPSPFDIAEYRGDSDASKLNELRNHLQSNYNYDAGDFGDKIDDLKGTKIFGKLDFNLNQSHKLTIRHQYTKAEQTNQNGSFATRINFANNGVYFPSTTHSFAAELNSTFGTGASNNLIVGYTSVFDDRDPIGQDFPYLTIDDGEGSIRLGSEQFSTANQLDQKIFTITDNFKLYKGKHTWTFGTHNEFYSIYNLFIRQNYGSYAFDSVDDFISGAPAVQYDRSFSLVDNITGDGSGAAADFQAMQLGFYVQDEIQISSQFSLTGGLRLDIPIITSEPTVDANFNTQVLPTLQSAYPIANDVEGGKAPDGQLMFSPRVGFNYDVNQDFTTVLRGGLGIFTSRIPFVWPGAMFSNNGLKVGGVDERGIEGDVTFIGDIENQYSNPEFSVPSGQLDLFVNNFKYPQVFRTNLALDKTFGSGYQLSLEAVYTKTLNNVLYTNINSDPAVDFTSTGVDARQIFTRNNLANDYSAIYVGSNTSEGHTYNFTVSLAKDFARGFNAFVAYTYGDGKSVNEGTSSQNSSQWRGQVHITGRNNPVLGRSDFSLGSRAIAALNYKLKWNASGSTATTFSLFYEGQSGRAFSYVIGDRNGRNYVNEGGSTSRNRTLPYIPATQSDIVLVEAGGKSPAEQWALLDAFIEDDPHLKESRGGYSEKNGSRAPFLGQWDLAIRQDFGIDLANTTHRFQVSLDVFNFANMISKSWGAVYNVVGDFNNSELYQFEGFDGQTPTYSFTNENLGSDKYSINGFDSRWRMRLGLRYLFN